MTKQQYKERSGQLRAAIKNNLEADWGPFRVADLRDMRYVYHTGTRNIIYKTRRQNQHVGIQYRATSIYRPVLERAIPDYSYLPYQVHARRVASPNMRRHVRDVRSALGIS